MLSFGIRDASLLDRLNALHAKLGPAEGEAKAEAETKENVYKLSEGPGLMITDRVNGIAKVTFMGMASERPRYSVTINGKPLVLSNSAEAKWNLIGSQKISFERQDGLIKITEVDESSTNEFWIDDIRRVEKLAYEVYNYKPKALTQEEAASKVNKLIQNHNFKSDFIVFNRHGVAAVGYDKEEYALFWANPHQTEVQKIPCWQIWHPGYYRDFGSACAKAEDGSIHFEFTLTGPVTNMEPSCFLNGELATLIEPAKAASESVAKEHSDAVKQ